MRMLVLLLLLLAGLGQAAVRLETTAPPDAAAAPFRWVRTVQGWERLDSLRRPPLARLALHPGVVAAGLLCGSLLALLAYDRDE